MAIYFDSDILCKLVLSDLHNDACAVFGANFADCYRLPALPYMLRKESTLQRNFGVRNCAVILNVVNAMLVAPSPDSEKLELYNQEGIDAGEAQLLACVSGTDDLLFTGDKRALKSLCGTSSLGDLAGRIVCLEGLLIHLCRSNNLVTVRTKVQKIHDYDKVLKICFSSADQDPVEALESYFRHTCAEAEPLRLWAPMA